MPYDYSYGYGYESPILALLPMLIQFLELASLVITYVFTALALYSIAKRRQIKYPWLGWVPVADVWLYGSVSDQYRYVARGEVKVKRKILLTLEIISVVISLVLLCMGFGFLFRAVSIIFSGALISDETMLGEIMSWLMYLMAVSLLTLPVTIGMAVVRYMALYDIYQSLDPKNTVLFLVLSIVFPVTEPFFLLCNRNKDLGMPPRKDAPAALAQPEAVEPVWQQPQQSWPQEQYAQDQYAQEQYVQDQYTQEQYVQNQYAQEQCVQEEYSQQQPQQPAEPAEIPQPEEVCREEVPALSEDTTPAEPVNLSENGE